MCRASSRSWQAADLARRRRAMGVRDDGSIRRTRTKLLAVGVTAPAARLCVGGPGARGALALFQYEIVRDHAEYLNSAKPHAVISRGGCRAEAPPTGRCEEEELRGILQLHQPRARNSGIFPTWMSQPTAIRVPKAACAGTSSASPRFEESAGSREKPARGSAGGRVVGRFRAVVCVDRPDAADRP